MKMAPAAANAAQWVTFISRATTQPARARTKAMMKTISTGNIDLASGEARSRRLVRGRVANAEQVVHDQVGLLTAHSVATRIGDGRRDQCSSRGSRELESRV